MFDKAAQAITEASDELKKQLEDISGQLAQLEAAKRALTSVAASGDKAAKTATGGRGARSAKSRALQSRRMKASWAARRKSKKGRKPGRPAKAITAKKVTAPKKVIKLKRNLSPAARKALSARMKAKWAAFRAKKAAA